MYMIAEVSQYVAVASFAEAWIEIFEYDASLQHVDVASFAEAWIEISDCPPNELNGKPPIKQSLLYKKIKIIVNVAKKYSP